MAQFDFDDDDGGSGAGWLATYGDMMTLLLCFFVLMFAMSETKMDDFAELIASLKSGIGKQNVPEAGTREGLSMMSKEAEVQPEAVDELGGMVKAQMDSIESNVEEFVMKNKLGGQVKVKQDGRGAVITISDVILFPPGDADFVSAGEDIMAKISELLKQFPYHIKIEGHTDNVPIHTDEYPSNWELSANRASKIVRYLIEHGIDPTQLSCEGFAEYRPVASNDTPEGRAKNRRVEIVYQRGEIEKQVMSMLEAKNQESKVAPPSPPTPD
ncbi:MAG: flagellar motor protein MotB [FCB group bacterium]|nr:flagellar motor protein MotB [FCB group bacterium]